MHCEHELEKLSGYSFGHICWGIKVHVHRYLQFENQDDLCLCFIHVIEADNVGVVDLLKQINLLLYVLHLGTSPSTPAPLPDELGGIFHDCQPVWAFPHHSKVATAIKKQPDMNVTISMCTWLLSSWDDWIKLYTTGILFCQQWNDRRNEWVSLVLVQFQTISAVLWRKLWGKQELMQDSSS